MTDHPEREWIKYKALQGGGCWICIPASKQHMYHLHRHLQELTPEDWRKICLLMMVEPGGVLEGVGQRGRGEDNYYIDRQENNHD